MTIHLLLFEVVLVLLLLERDQRCVLILVHAYLLTFEHYSLLHLLVVDIIARNLLHQKQLQARQTAEDIVEQGKKEADNIKKEKLLEAKEENQILKEQSENDL